MFIKKKTAVLSAVLGTALMLGGCADPMKDGTASLEEGKYDEAVTEFTEASESEDKEVSAEGCRGLGLAYYGMEDYAKALESFENAVDKGAEQTVQLYNLMGVSAMQTGDYVKGLEYIQAGLAVADTASGGDTDDALLQEMKFNEIVCYEQQADWENAKTRMSEYISQYPDDEAAQKEAEFLQTR